MSEIEVVNQLVSSSPAIGVIVYIIFRFEKRINKLEKKVDMIMARLMRNA